MSKRAEHDDVIDGILRGALGPGTAGHERGPACVDVEQMAAWIDGGLTAPAAQHVEAHLAACPHCQMVLATFAATDAAADHVAAPVIIPFWRRWALPWLVPATAGIATVVLWSMLRLQAPHEAPMQSARVEPADTLAQGSGAAPIVVPPPPPSSQTLVDERAQNAYREIRPAEKAEEPSAAKMAAAAPTAVPAPAASAAVPTGTRTFSDAAADRARETTMSARADMAASTAAANEARVAAGATPVTAPGEPSNAIILEFGIVPPSMQMLARQEVTVEPSAPPVAPAAPRAGASGRGGATQSVVGGIASAPPPPPALAVSASPVPARWRVYADGRVERFVPAAAVWEPVVIAPPAAVTTGSAPTALVCWLAGRGGVVLRTGDGRTFTRVSLPVVVDVASIVAAGALEARVTTVGGRVFTTTDGGTNWR